MATAARPTIGLMLGQRRRRWPSIRPTLVQLILIAQSYMLRLLVCDVDANEREDKTALLCIAVRQ